MKIDLHNHTNASVDALTLIDELIKEAKKKGVDCLAITDHNTMKAVKEGEKKAKKENIKIIGGEEISTKDGDLIGLFLLEEIKGGMSFYETLDEIRIQGAIAYAPHPFDYRRRGLRNIEFLKKCDVIEVFNPRAEEKADKEAMSFASLNNMLKGAGSDSHMPSEIGRAYIEIEDDNISIPEKFLKSLKNSKPFLVQRTSIFERVFKNTLLYFKNNFKKEKENNKEIKL